MHFDHVGISVSDLDRATRWYTDAMDLHVDFAFAMEQFDFRGVMLISPAGYRIELLERAGSRPGLEAPDPLTAALTRGYGHMGLRVDDVDTTFRALLAAGASERMAPRPAPEPGCRVAFVADPDGNLIELLDRPAASGSS
ncbi:MAG TPA: VOC family protein [Actinomycetes bacterium]|nr:VOC family protein [Actinomycetes bacterium]